VTLRDALLAKVPRNQRDPDAVWHRRRKIVAGTVVVGAGLLERSLSAEPDSTPFYAWSMAVASTWVVGGLASGPLHLGRELGPGGALRRPVATPIATGVGAFGVFYGCALVCRQIPVLERAISSVLTYADEGSTLPVLATTLANGAAEEVFFRGALYAAVGQRPAVVSTAAYTATTLATKNPSLVLAASVMGSLFGLQRRTTGGIQAPLITHLTWSVLMLRFLPPLFRSKAQELRH
jgi:membrane protease YdiL (CAAX protease family)